MKIIYLTSFLKIITLFIVALLDRPTEVSGCRARKKVERLEMSFSAPKEKQELPEGKGKKLGDIPRSM